jgi:hypothetical protein
MFVTFISIHLVIVCIVLFWCTYEMHSGLLLKSECDSSYLVRQLSVFRTNTWQENLCMRNLDPSGVISGRKIYTGSGRTSLHLVFGGSH